MTIGEGEKIRMDYNYDLDPQERRHLAWHETLELHELIAFSSVGLMKTKMGMGKIKDQALRSIYTQSIGDLEGNIRELLRFIPMAPNAREEDDLRNPDDAFYAGDLLAFFKTAVRNYGIAITETATPELKQVLKKQMVGAVDAHTRIYNYMYQRGLYPSYQLDKLLANDVNLARKALSMRY